MKSRGIDTKIEIHLGLPLWLLGVVSFVIFGFFAALTLSAREAQAAPYLGCSTSGYIFKYGPPTEVQAVDMVTGQGSSAGSVAGRQLNAVGYNPKDNHFYAWDLQAGVPVKVSSDFATTTPLTYTGYSGPTANLFSGDVDEDGYHWFFVGNTWYQVDLNTTPDPTFVASGTPGSNPTGTEGTDWAYVPGTDSLYRAMNNGTDLTIWAFNRTGKTWSSVGTVSNVTAVADRDIGAVYADPNGNFYMSSHNSGRLWRVDLGNTPPFTAVQLGASDPNSNDGARCALASIPVDFGDAPSSYGTLIADDGPRHSIINFDITNSTAPLMLGTHIDIEVDGFPGSNADGDDTDHEGLSGSSYVDDERGVTHIVATPGVPTALSIPVTVTSTIGSASTLAGWVDLDNDGVFETSERVVKEIPANSGTATYELDFPSATFSANSHARFRIFDGNLADIPNPQPIGFARGGEVEDITVQVGTYKASKTSDPAEGTQIATGSTITYTLTLQNTGSTPLTNLKVQDDMSKVLDDATIQGSPVVTPGGAGTAVFDGDMLEFTGDIGVGQTVTVTYAVKVKSGALLGDTNLQNTLLAAHSNCHPDVNGASVVVSDPDCQTTHTVDHLANTGTSILTPLVLAITLLGAAGGALYFARRASFSK